MGGGIIMTCIALPHNIVSSFRLSSCYMSVGVCVCVYCFVHALSKWLQKASSQR